MRYSFVQGNAQIVPAVFDTKYGTAGVNQVKLSFSHKVVAIHVCQVHLLSAATLGTSIGNLYKNVAFVFDSSLCSNKSLDVYTILLLVINQVCVVTLTTFHQ